MRRFPLELQGSYLVLADASEGELCAFWQVSSDDLIPVIAGFLRNGAEPLPVLRLRRLHAGGAELIRAIPLRLTGPGGRGEQLFSIGVQPGRYDAELGVSDAAGGWLMLARSNALDHAARVDVRIGTIQPRSDPQGSVWPQTVTPDAAASMPSSRPTSILPSTPPLAPRDASRIPQPTRAADGQGNAATWFPDQGIARTLFEPVRAHPIQPRRLGNALDPIAPATARAGDAVRQDASAEVEPRLAGTAAAGAEADGAPSIVAGTRDTPLTQRSGAAQPSASPIAPLVYGQPSPRPGELMIEAELRVNGCAAPGSEIDLFGYPYRVGPGGRFQLIIRVDDPELIARAFARNPPVLPERSEDD